jgi:hypothetical protein
LILLNKGSQKVIGQEGRVQRYKRRNGGIKKQMEVEVIKEENGRRTMERNKKRERKKNK